jgi:hypothetical protein|tara:strand:- start:972 stop:2537 length:1566 start_codon:yes stop_codon:yes gene_type:complete
MASFTDQIGYYAGGTSGYSSEISQWLIDGVKTIVTQAEQINKDLLDMFSLETSVTSGSGFDVTANGRVLDVQRDDRRATPIKNQWRGKISDVNSIYYAPSTDPKYFVLNGKLYVKPDPTSSASAKVSHVTYGTISDASSPSISYFPSEFYKHVVLWVAANLIHAKMVALREALPSDLDGDATVFDAITDLALNMSLPNSPDAPSYGSVASFGSAPAYSKPSFTAPSFPSIAALDLSTSGNAQITALALSITSPGTPDTLSYTRPTISGDGDESSETLSAMTGDTTGTDSDWINYATWFTALSDMIEDQEDVELAEAQIGKISTYVQAYATQMQNNLNEFNVNLESYRQKLSRTQTDSSAFQAELARFQAQVNSEVQEWVNNELQNKFQKWVTEYSNKLQEYSMDVQNELNEFNKENVAYQATIQKNITEFQAKDSEYAAGLQEYATEIQEYQALINKEVQLFSTNLEKKLRSYETVIQKDTVDYQWLQGQMQYIQAMYERCWAPYAGASADANTAFVGVKK